MSYSGDIKKFGEWIRREIKINDIVYNKDSLGMSEGSISCRIVVMGDEDIETKRDFRFINLTVRLQSDPGSWEKVIDTAQILQNNLLRERDFNVNFGEMENPDGINVEGGEFMLDIPVQIRVSTGQEAL